MEAVIPVGGDFSSSQPAASTTNKIYSVKADQRTKINLTNKKDLSKFESIGFDVIKVGDTVIMGVDKNQDLNKESFIAKEILVIR